MRENYRDIRQWLSRARGMKMRLKSLQSGDIKTTKLKQIRAEISSVIEQVQDNTLATLLIEYYLNDKSWVEVAAALGYSYQTVVQRKHPDALKAVADLIKVDKE